MVIPDDELKTLLLKNGIFDAKKISEIEGYMKNTGINFYIRPGE